MNARHEKQRDRGESDDSPRLPFRDWFSGNNIITAVLALTFLTWLGFHFTPSPPPVLDQALATVLGAWVTNKAIDQRNREVKVDDKIKKLEDLATQSHPETAERLGLSGDGS